MIPKIIHQIWVGDLPIPEKSVEFIKNIKTLHPEYEYRLWNNDDLTPLNFSNILYINKASSNAQKADMMRYEILYRFGGIYLDIDFELFKSIDGLLKNKMVVCNEDGNIDQYMSNSFIACTKGNENLHRCVQAIKTVDYNAPINHSTGPYFFRKNIDLNEDATLLPTINMYPKHWSERAKVIEKTDEIFGVHHWDKNW